MRVTTLVDFLLRTKSALTQLHRHFVVIAAFVIALSAKSQVVDQFNPGVDGTGLGDGLPKRRQGLVGGAFTALSGHQRQSLGRLNPDCALEEFPDFQFGSHHSPVQAADCG